jgi:ATP sulfurylase
MFSDRPLSGEAIRYFVREGYLLSAEFFSPEQITQLVEALEDSYRERDAADLYF